jgi:hypothetical protein
LYPPLILLGLLCIPFGVWCLIKIRGTPKDQLVELAGVWQKRGTAYVFAFAFFYMAALLFIEGLIVPS